MLASILPLLAAGPPDLVILHPEALAPAANAWAEHRGRTHAVALVPVPAGLGPAEVRALAAGAIGEVAAGDCVLVLGDADAIPPWRFEQHDESLRDRRDPTYATDHPYQLLVGDDEVPDVALGRVPARSVEEALALLEKLRRHESGSLGLSPSRVTYAAGEGHFGPMDRLLEAMFLRLVDEYVDPAYEVRALYAKPTSPYCPPPDMIEGEVLRLLGEGSMFFNYVGHGSARGLDRVTWRGDPWPILRADAVERAEHKPSNSCTQAALFTCCSAGWFDLDDGSRSLGESILFHNGLAVSVVAGSRPTHPYGNAVFQKDFTACLLSEDLATIGEVELEATRRLLAVDEDDAEVDALSLPIALAMRWPTTLAEHRVMHARLYNLLGDPAMPIRRPRRAEVEVAGGEVVARFPGMESGTCLIHFETDRRGSNEPDQIRVLDDVEGEDAPAAMRRNYGASNARTLGFARTSLRGGEIRWKFEPPPGTRVIRVVGMSNRQGAAPGAMWLGSVTLPE